MTHANAQSIQIAEDCTIHPPAGFVPVEGMFPGAAYSAIDYHQGVYLVLVMEPKTKLGYVKQEVAQAKMRSLQEKLLVDQARPSYWPGSYRKIAHARGLKASTSMQSKGDTLMYELYVVETRRNFFYLYVWASLEGLRERAPVFTAIEESFFECKRWKTDSH